MQQESYSLDQSGSIDRFMRASGPDLQLSEDDLATNVYSSNSSEEQEVTSQLAVQVDEV